MHIRSEADIRQAIVGYGRLYLGSMNDGLFIIDGPPSPAGADVGPHLRAGQAKCVTATWPVSTVTVKRIVDDHNANPSARFHAAAIVAGLSSS